MEIIKIEDVDHISNGDHICAEKRTCLLQESDAQCGYVFYNEFTRLLKFNCTYCQETYDNIEYFCQHLSDHINESIEEKYNIENSVFKQEGVELESIENLNVDDSESKSLCLLKDSNELEINSYSSSPTNEDYAGGVFEYEHQLEPVSSPNENICSGEFVDNMTNTEMFIEEIEETEEIRTEELNNYDEKNMPTIAIATPNDNPKNGNSFEECFIKETNIDRIRSEGVCVLKERNQDVRKPTQKKRSNIQDLLRLKRRRKKITTVKVIAVKNRIAELYEKIQNEQQKSQQFFTNDFLNVQQEQETQDAIESLTHSEVKDIIGTENLNKNLQHQSPSDISRKIVGETLITLIPEGTKIPNKFPSHINTATNNEFLNSSNKFPFATSNICKVEEKKEKIAVCPACGKTFRSHFSLTIHKRIHYLESDSSVKLAHKCSDCDQLFNKLSQLKHHVETVHYPEGFVCKICNRQLSSLSLLERHMVKVHLDRPFNCQKCNKNFSDPLTFEEHLASHSSGEIFKCTTCGRKYSTEYFLLEHMRNHKEQVPQTCVVCGKVTLRITQHMKIHTPRPKRLLSCSECGKVFNFSSGLSHHFKIMHKLPRPPPKPTKDTHSNIFKRKRRSRTNERSVNKKKQLHNSSIKDSAVIVDNENCPDQIIEEQMEIPNEVYGSTTHLDRTSLTERDIQCIEEQVTLKSSSHIYLSNSLEDQHVYQNVQQDTINHKEEEAKRVIVELIQNSTYTSYFPDNFSNVLEVTPPIAREETISAINSIVHDC